MFRAYALRISIFAASGLLIGFVISLLMPKRYEGTIQILVSQSPLQQARSMDPAEASVSDLTDATRPRTVATQVEQLTGFGVLSRAAQSTVEKLGLDPNNVPELQPLNLAHAINVEAANESDFVTLNVRMPTPELAATVATEIYNAFDSENERNAREMGQRAFNFLKTQTGLIQGDLDKVDGKLEQVRSKYNAPNIDYMVQSDITSNKGLQDAYDQARIEFAGAQARATDLKAGLAGVPRVIESSSATGVNATYQRLETDLAEAQAERAQLAADWSPGSVALRSADEKIQNLRAALKQMKFQVASGKQRSINPLYQSLATELADARSLEASAKEKLTAASLAMGERQASMKDLPQEQREITNLVRQQESLQQNYLTYKNALESVRVAQRGRITPSVMVSPAFVNPKPVSPNLPLNLGAGLMAGILLGVLSAFNSESRRSPIRTLSHLNRLSFEPSYRSIPELPIAVVKADKAPDDAFTALLANFARSQKRPYRLGVMGVDFGAGASTVAASLGVAASLDGHSTLVVDTAEKGGAAEKLGVGAERMSHPNPQLTVARPNPSDAEGNMVGTALSSPPSLELFDLPTYQSGQRPSALVANLDECILLVRAGRTRSVDFLQAQQILADIGIPQITVVLSRAKGLDDDFTFVDSDLAPASYLR